MTEEIKEIVNKIDKSLKGIEHVFQDIRTWFAIDPLGSRIIRDHIKDIKSNLDRLMKIDEQLSREEEE